MNSIDESIINSSKIISQNIELTKKISDIGFLSQNILSQLRTLVESIALKLYKDEENETQLIYSDIQKALKYIKRNSNYNFLSKFHQSLAIAKSHYISDDENAARLLFIYFEYLEKIKKLLKDKYSFDILENIDALIFNIDTNLETFYESIVEIINKTPDFNSNINTWSDYCNVIKKRPFIINDELYYEITFSLAVSNSSKSERVIAYTKFDIFSEYTVKISMEKAYVEILDKIMPINIINGWVVAIQPSAINKLSKIMNMNMVVKSNMYEYERVMSFLGTTRYNLLDLVLEDEPYYKAIIQRIKGKSKSTYISDLLNKIRLFILSKSNGSNTIKYLLYKLDLDIISHQISYEQCTLLSNLKLGYGCIPFEEMPYASSLIFHNPKLYDLLRCINANSREHEFFFRKINTNTQLNGKIYTDISELQNYDNIDNLISTFNSKVYYKHTGRYLKKYDNYIYISQYEDDSLKIINDLKNFSNNGLNGYSNKVIPWLNEIGDSLSTDKKDIITTMFVNSKVALIYGAAGTGKTTLLKYISELFLENSKLYLANTHPAVENLRRRVGNDKGNFSTIHSYISNTQNNSCDLLIIDECSTVSNEDMVRVLNKVTTELIILVGDIHQIESIVFGNWFSLVKYFLPQNTVYELTQPFRSENENLKLIWKSVRKMDGFTEMHLLKNNCCSNLNSSIFENSYKNNIILCLNYDGLYGVNNINKFLQANNPNQFIEWGISTYKVGDPILFTDSDRYKPIIYNNLKGEIININKQSDKIIFDILIDRALTDINMKGSDLKLLDCKIQGKSIIQLTINKYINDDEVDVNTVVPFQIAYAVSIHKAQGLEYDSVKIVITDEVGELITHNIFYTAITRARKDLKIYWSNETQNTVLSNMKLSDSKKDANILRSKFAL